MVTFRGWNSAAQPCPCSATSIPNRFSFKATRVPEQHTGSNQPLETRSRLQERRRWCSVQATSSSTDAPEITSDSAISEGEPPAAQSWELDFSSRPILDERGKKKWELLICSPDGAWKYSRFFPNNKINSTQLRMTLEEILSQEGAVTPRSVRFFRAQMQTIISRAFTDLGIKAIPSRRCFTLTRWLEDRLETVYKKDPGFSDKSSSLFTLDLGAPEKLPDNLRGERWSFVQLPLATLQDELKLVDEGTIFGDTMTLDQASATDLPPTTSIPGKFHPFLLAYNDGDTLLSDGLQKILKKLKLGRKQKIDATSLCRGLHFLAVQKDEEADQCDGLWLLQDRELPSI